jgi:probable rRNA maturation factor
MRKLNFKFLKKRYSTDVIAFELSDTFESHLTGEIYINMELLPQQAKQYQISLNNELVRLVSHGIYHLLGYEDKTDAQRKIMTQLEDLVLKQFHLKV